MKIKFPATACFGGRGEMQPAPPGVKCPRSDFDGFQNKIGFLALYSRPGANTFMFRAKMA